MYHVPNGPSQLGLATFQKVSSHVWLAVTVLDSTAQKQWTVRKEGGEERNNSYIKRSKQSREVVWAIVIKKIQWSEKKVIGPLWIVRPGRSLRRWHQHWGLKGRQSSWARIWGQPGRVFWTDGTSHVEISRQDKSTSFLPARVIHSFSLSVFRQISFHRRGPW